MKNHDKTRSQLVNELVKLRQQLADFKIIEEQRNKAENLLKEAETRYRRLFETAKDGILILDADTGQIMDVNPFLTEMLGYSHKEFLGKKLCDIGPFKDIELAKTAFRELQKKNYIRYDHLPLETKDGRNIDVEFISNVYLVNGKRVIQCNIRDITEYKRAEKEIQKLNKELEQKLFELTETNKELDAFNHSIAHDLRTPLVIIGGYTYRLLKKYGDNLDTKGRDMLENIQVSVKNMERLIRGLLAFSYFGHHRIKSKLIDMENLARIVLNELKPLYDQGRVKLDIKRLPPGYGDIELIKQVFNNLLINAFKFTQPIRKPPIIEIGGYPEKEENVFYVKDNGIGFKSRDKDKLFAIFQKVHNREDIEGTGLGLPIVERIIKRHNGRVGQKEKLIKEQHFISHFQK